MALKPCRECGKAVSTDASKCPHCGTPHPTSKFSRGARGCLWVIGVVFALGILSTLVPETEDVDSTAQQTSPVPVVQSSPVASPADPAQTAINKWLTSWSKAQASSARETCEKEAGCDPAKYAPEARPETSFGWDGAQSIQRIEDWAKGPRYQVAANGRTLLVYLEGLKIVGVYMLADDSRTNVCRDAACAPE